ncbi:MAG: DUF692 family protein [Gammaproteobacteria bacterium]|nr:DUF692 family protein [Gammaproteobacteria bacterium]
MRLGVGYRREMYGWDLSQLPVDFYEVVPENWLRKDSLEPLLNLGKPVFLHGVSLNLGGSSEINFEMLRGIKGMLKILGNEVYSDHLASSGDNFQLYDLFPIPFTEKSLRHTVDRIVQVQEFLGICMGIENSAYYTNVGDYAEVEFIEEVIKCSGSCLLLDTNNLLCNYKNHGQTYMRNQPWQRLISLPHRGYQHLAGHEWSEKFHLFWDTHGAHPDLECMNMALEANRDILLEWDNALPAEQHFGEILCKMRTFFPS